MSKFFSCFGSKSSESETKITKAPLPTLTEVMPDTAPAHLNIPETETPPITVDTLLTGDNNPDIPKEGAV